MGKRKFSMDWDEFDKHVEEQDKKKSYKDDRVYYPEIKNGTAEAIIRFLPAPDSKIPYVLLHNHAFRGLGGSFLFENCPKTPNIGGKCPICEANSAIWEENENLARPRLKKWNYYSNILVVKDPQHPENEGKVFLFRYGKKIHDKIMEKKKPQEDSIDDPVNVFEYYEGANFRLKIKLVKVKMRDGKVKEMPNYDSSSFDNVSECCDGDDDKIEQIHNQRYNILEFVDPAKFKSYEQILDRFENVVGQQNAAPQRILTTVEPDSVSVVEENTDTSIDVDDVDDVDSTDDDVFDGDDEVFFKELQDN